MALLTTYERKARLTPGLYGILPIATTITTLGLDRNPLIAGLAGVLSTAGGMWVLSNVVGNIGRGAEPDLHARWGGAPTTKALRLREPTSNPVQRDGWRAATQNLTGITFSNEAEEHADPDTADQQIEAATAQLLYLGQQGGVDAVCNENAAFGYQRNMHGFRHIGRAIALIAAVVQLAMIFTSAQVSTGACITGAFVSMAFLALWVLLPSEDEARAAGERYARQLFIAAQNEATATTQTKGR